MNRVSRPLLPFAISATCLLILSLLASQAWRSSSPADRSAAASERSLSGGDPSEAEGDGDVPEATSTAESVEAERSIARPAEPSRWDLEALAAPRRPQTIAPPVAERIAQDPSLAETPSLPPTMVSPAGPASARRRETAAAVPPVQPVPATAPRTWDPVHQAVQSWPFPASLLQQLDELRAVPIAASWSEQVIGDLEAMRFLPSLESAEAGVLLDRLRRAAAAAAPLAERTETLNERSQMLRAAYALERRVELWEPIHRLAVSPDSGDFVSVGERQHAARALRGVVDFLDGHPQGPAWIDYLLLRELAAHVNRSATADSTRRSRLARSILLRMESTRLTFHQQRFLHQQPFLDLKDELRHWVNEPVDYLKLLDALEHYEQTGALIESQYIAASYQILRWSTNPQVQALSDSINAHYRNANLRVAVSEELINLLLPDPEMIHEPVNQELAGARVQGHSSTSTRLRVTLVPDRIRWRLGLEADGQIQSRTESSRGPATFYNNGESWYRARTFLQIDRRGARLGSAEADVDARNNLTGMATDFDAVPLLNVIARAMARQQYDSRVYEAEGEVKGMVAAEARRRLDQEVQVQLQRANEMFQERFYGPLSDLALEPTAVGMETTDERLIVRYRIASGDQLGSHSPRPQAPADSLLSVQVHHSTLNNLVDQLQLGGRRSTLRDLYREVTMKLGRSELEVPEDFPEGVEVLLAEEEPIRFHFDGDLLHVNIRIAELSQGRRSWRNFTVRAAYRPRIDGLHATLEREGHIGLKGGRGQLVLRGIFSKVLAQRPEFELVSEKLISQPGLADARISQFVLRHGWLGMAIGPRDGISLYVGDEHDTATR